MTGTGATGPPPSTWYGAASLLASFVGTVVVGILVVMGVEWLLWTVPVTGVALLLAPRLRRVGTGLVAASLALAWLPVWLSLAG